MVRFYYLRLGLGFVRRFRKRLVIIVNLLDVPVGKGVGLMSAGRETINSEENKDAHFIAYTYPLVSTVLDAFC